MATFKDSTKITLNEADLTGMKVGKKFLTPKRSVSGADGLAWWIDYRPAGDRDAAKGHVSVYLWVNTPVRSKFTFVVDNSSISQTGNTKFYEKPKGKGWCQFASHEQLRPLFRDGKLTITCSVEFDISEPAISVPRVFQLFEHVPMDVEFVVGSEKVPAHKNFVIMISPVFQVMLTNSVTESESGKIEITEFDFETVNAAIDICYGREPASLSVETVVGILRFCERYVITGVIKELENLLILKLSVQDFCTIVKYAYDSNKDKLLTACHKYFKNRQGKVKATEEFAKLPPALVVKLLKSTFNLKTDYDVLRHAHKYSMVFVMNHLEQPLITSMTMDHIVTAINFAWGYSRKNLKKACLKYFNANRDEILSMKTFYMLDSETIGNLMKASHNAK